MAERPDILVRGAEPADFEAFHRILSQPRAIWGTLQLPYASAELWRKRLSDPPAGSHLLVAEVDRVVVGQLGLHTFPNRPRRVHVGQIGMAVRDDFQGRGVGSALLAAAVELADRWLNLLRLELDVYVDNERAIALYRKYGFEIEGTMRAYAYRDGELVDSYQMARLRSKA